MRRCGHADRHRSLIILFSDLLAEPQPICIDSLHLLRHAKHDVILFHILLDEAEVTFPICTAWSDS